MRVVSSGHPEFGLKQILRLCIHLSGRHPRPEQLCDIKREPSGRRHQASDCRCNRRIARQIAHLKKPAQIKRYLRQYFVNVPVEDLQGRSEKIMARIAVDHLEFGARRRAGQALMRIYNATEKEHGYTSAFTFVEMVNDDMPFLVDSVAAAINRHSMTFTLRYTRSFRSSVTTKVKITDVTEAKDE